MGLDPILEMLLLSEPELELLQLANDERLIFLAGSGGGTLFGGRGGGGDSPALALGVGASRPI